MAGGELIIFLAVNNDMIDAEFKLEPRSLSNTMHGLEYLEKTRWGRFRRYAAFCTLLAKMRADKAASLDRVSKEMLELLPDELRHADSRDVPSQARRSRTRTPTRRAAPPPRSRSRSSRR